MHSNPGFRALSYCRDRRDNRQWMARKEKEGISGNPFWPATTGRKGGVTTQHDKSSFAFYGILILRPTGTRKTSVPEDEHERICL